MNLFLSFQEPETLASRDMLLKYKMLLVGATGEVAESSSGGKYFGVSDIFIK